MGMTSCCAGADGAGVAGTAGAEAGRGGEDFVGIAPAAGAGAGPPGRARLTMMGREDGDSKRRNDCTDAGAIRHGTKAEKRSEPLALDLCGKRDAGRRL